MAHETLPDPFAPINRALRDLEQFVQDPAPFRPLEQAAKNAETTLGEVTALPTLIVMCAWCSVITTPGTGPDITHGICEPCFEQLLPGVKR